MIWHFRPNKFPLNFHEFPGILFPPVGTSCGKIYRGVDQASLVHSNGVDSHWIRVVVSLSIPNSGHGPGISSSDWSNP